jgi:hypothetical protein
MKMMMMTHHTCCTTLEASRIHCSIKSSFLFEILKKAVHACVCFHIIELRIWNSSKLIILKTLEVNKDGSPNLYSL